MTKTPTIQEVLDSHRADTYRLHDDAGRVLDWTGAPIAVGSRVEWHAADGALTSGVVRRVSDRPGALWDGSTDAALTIEVTPSHTAVCSSRSVRVI